MPLRIDIDDVVEPRLLGRRLDVPWFKTVSTISFALAVILFLTESGMREAGRGL